MAAICCEIQNKRRAIAAKYKTKEVKQKSAIIFKVCHETRAQLGGCLDGIPCPFTMPIKKTKNYRPVVPNLFGVMNPFDNMAKICAPLK